MTPHYHFRQPLQAAVFLCLLILVTRKRVYIFFDADLICGVVLLQLVSDMLRYKEALNHTFDEPKQWEIREINEIMNQCITGWRYFPNPRMFSEYGRQKGWERENPATDLCNPSEKTMDGFVEVTEQMELPF